MIVSLRNLPSFGLILALVSANALAQVRTEWRSAYLRCSASTLIDRDHPPAIVEAIDPRQR